MLSNVFTRLLTSVRPMQNYQQHFLRLLSSAESISTENTTNNRETGIVKRFSKEKGYGFISKNSDGTDFFVHFKSINTDGFKALEQGQEVEFTAIQGQKGPEAKDVSILNTGTSRSPFSGSSSYNNSTSSRFGFGNTSRNQSSSVFEFGGTTSSKLHSENEDSTSTERSFNLRRGVTNSNTDNLFSSRQPRTDNVQQRQMGSVKRWSNERGFGFIRRNSGGQDIFCHARSLKNGIQALEEGQTVEYRIQRTDKGEEARDVIILDEESLTSQQEDIPSPTNSNERQTGTVKRWIPEKGYGFVQRQNGGSDVFVHLRDLTDGNTSLEEGQIVEFDIKNGDKGEIAQNVIVRNET